MLFTCIWRAGRGGVGITETGLLSSRGHRAFGGDEALCRLSREADAGRDEGRYRAVCNAQCRVRTCVGMCGEFRE